MRLQPFRRLVLCQLPPGVAVDEDDVGLGELLSEGVGGHLGVVGCQKEGEDGPVCDDGEGVVWIAGCKLGYGRSPPLVRVQL